MGNTAVDVYWIDMDAEDPDFRRFADTLSAEERHRAEKFRFERDRRRFVVRRGKLRELLSAQIGCVPARIRFSYGPFGKPFVAGCDLGFNLSHARQVALYVIGRGLEPGCDIAWRDPGFCREQIPERLFSPRELATLRALAPERQAGAFFRWWTRKEAFIKARGLGLSVPIERFEVLAAPAAPAALSSGCEGWSARSIEPVPGFEAAVVAESTDWQLCEHPPTRPERRDAA